MTAFVDFHKVWLAYDDELLAREQFIVEDISLQVGRGEFIAGHERRAHGGRSREAG